MHYPSIKLYILRFIEKIQDFNSRIELFLDIWTGFNNEIISKLFIIRN